VRAALVDPRPIRSDPRAKRTVRRTARELTHTLDQLERWVRGRAAPAR